MNFLAHIFLSGEDDFVKIGNFMADGIHGKKYLHFPETIQKGIVLHRAIDSFTDAHPTFRQSTKRLHEPYHHYSGVIVDVFYDHFLAKNWNRYSEESLENYVARFYQSLYDNYELLTQRTQHLLPYMVEQNWLVSYQTTEGIQQILTQMDRRTKNKSNMQFSVNELVLYSTEFENEFTLFFKELIDFSANKRNELWHL